MSRFIRIVLLWLVVALFYVSCSPSTETIEQNIDIVIGNGSFSIGDGEISYKVENINLKRGETLRISFEKSETSNPKAALVVCWDGNEVATLKDFPTTFTKVMEQVGTHALSLKKATRNDDGTYEVESTVAANIDLFIR